MKNILIALIVGLSLTSTALAKQKSGEVSGHVKWGSNLTDDEMKIEESAVLYIFAKKTGDGPGRPMAVKKVEQPFKFPLEFTLSEKDVMVPDIPFEGPMHVTARISQSGSAMPVESGDIEGSTKKPVKVGTKDIEIELDTIK